MSFWENFYLPQIALLVSVGFATFFLVRKNPAFSRKLFELSPTSSNYRFSRPSAVVRFVSAIVALVSLTAYALGFGGSIRSGGSADVAFVLDVSKSMDALDGGSEISSEISDDSNSEEDSGSEAMAVSRLDAAKALIERLVRTHPENRYSLSVFNDRSYPVIPPTSDSEAFLLLLSGVSTKYAQNGTTDLAATFSSFVSDLRAMDSKRPAGSEAGKEVQVWSDGDFSEGKRRMVVILTDGWDAEDTPSSETFLNAAFPIKAETAFLIFGIGSKKGAPIPVGTDVFGANINLTYAGKTVVTKRNDEALSRLADASGGKYVALDGKSGTESRAASRFSSELTKVAKRREGGSTIGPAPIDGSVSTSGGFPVTFLSFLFFFSFSVMFPDRFLRRTKTPS